MDREQIFATLPPLHHLLGICNIHSVKNPFLYLPWIEIQDECGCLVATFVIYTTCSQTKT